MAVSSVSLYTDFGAYFHDRLKPCNDKINIYYHRSKSFEIWCPDKYFDDQKWVVFSGTLLWLSPSLNLQDLSLPVITVCPKHIQDNHHIMGQTNKI
jgi:hypothetical protein